MEDQDLQRPGDSGPETPPGLAPLCALRFSVADITDVEALAPGRRVTLQIIPGSEIDGARIRGHLLPGGTFTQTGRADNVVEVEGRFVIETDDNHHIAARSIGLISLPPRFAAQLARGKPYDPTELYARGAILFEAAEGSPYAWMNRGLYLVRTEWRGPHAYSTVWRVQ